MIFNKVNHKYNDVQSVVNNWNYEWKFYFIFAIWLEQWILRKLHLTQIIEKLWEEAER